VKPFEPLVPIRQSNSAGKLKRFTGQADLSRKFGSRR
jgi:hypothetical protein